MKKLLLLAVTLSIFSVNIQSQIQSTAFGGYWNDPNTWVGGIIPGAGNDVIILGPVVQGSANGYDILTEYCKNLTITSNGSLKNAEYGGGSGIFPLVVSGSVVNNGIVSDGTSDFIKIFISGDLENNNIWMPYQTEFNTSNNHNLSLSPGKSFGSKITNNGSPTITALTDMLFTCDYTSDGNLYRDNFYLNGQTFNVDNHSIELRQCLINSGTLTGDFQINGNFKVDMNSADTLVFIGNIVVSDTLTCNEYGGGHAIEKLKIIGDIINNGVIMDNDGSNPDDLSILITGNITNNGVWTCNFVNLIGTDTQFISQNPGKQFNSYFSDLNANSKVQALSDITITKDFNLNGATLEMEGHTLTINGWLHNGFTNNTKLHNGYLQNLTSLDNLIIEGLVTVESNNVFQNSVIIKDTLQSKEYGGGSTIYTLLIDGDITNHGVIQNINSGDMLSLEIYGSTYNDGTWKNSFTKFAGTLHQNIHQSAGKKFVTDFSDLDSTSKIIATSDLKIEGNFDLGRSNLQMDNYEIDISGNLYNGNITSPKIKNATLSNIKTYGNVEIRGVVVIDDGNYFYGDLLVTDTLQSQVYGGGAHTYVLENFGNVENYGLIRDEPTQSENFAMYVQGNITNKGQWTNYRSYQLFYPNHNLNTVSCFNTGTTNWLFNGSNITGGGASAYSITSGGGVQNISPNQSYDLSLQFNPTGGDTTATLNIDCTEIGSLNNIYLIGHNYNTTVDVEEEKNPVLPNEFVLNQNYPNPFNPSTKISWQSPVGNWQTLKIYDVLGNLVSTLVDEYEPAGRYEVEFQSSVGSLRLASGVYFYRLQVGSFNQTKKIVVLK